MTKKTNITFEHVSKVSSNMIKNGIKPSVRSVMQVTGGKTEIVSSFLRDFHDKRDAEVSTMADELGSSDIAKLLASEVQNVVDRKTASLTDVVERQKIQISEMVELLSEKESECQELIELTENKCNQSINSIYEQFEENKKIISTAETEKEKANAQVVFIQTEAQKTILNAEQKAIAIIEAAKAESESLVKAANHQLEKVESETVVLREQVKSLAVDAAKQEIKQAQYDQTIKQLEGLQLSISDNQMLVVQLQTEKTAFTKDNVRLEADLKESKIKVDELSQSHVQLIEVQKQLSQSQHDFSQLQRERDSLSQALESIKFN